MKHLASKFVLDPEIHFLNHGSFGACPTAVLDSYFAWVRRLERQPVLFLGREHHTLVNDTRATLANFVHADPAQLVFVPNTTYAVNLMAKALQLQSGDEIVTTNHEYGACENIWIYHWQKRGVKIKKAHIPLPYGGSEQAVERVWQHVSARTKAIFISEITSPSALHFPIATICEKARQQGIITCIDGAHVPGQINLDLDKLGADFYAGNCHKWLCAPKGAAFLYTDRQWLKHIKPLIVSWGTGPNFENATGNQLLDATQWTGTDNPCAALTVPSAIEFQRDNNWDQVRRSCHKMLSDALHEIQSLTGYPPAYPAENAFHQMAITEIPAQRDALILKNFLYERYRVEIPIIQWEGRTFVRISVQGYNTEKDLEVLIKGLGDYLQKSE